MIMHWMNISHAHALCFTGSNASLELYLRTLFRRVFLEPYEDDNDKCFWITLLLKPFPIVNQSRMLYLMFGAADAG